METLERIREIYDSQKAESHSIAFFWVGSKYIALFDDAHFINNVLNHKLSFAEFDEDNIPYIEINEEEILNVATKLTSRSLVSVSIIETQEFDFK